MKKIDKSCVRTLWMGLCCCMFICFNHASAQEFNNSIYQTKTSATFNLKGNVTALEQNSVFPEGIPTILSVALRPEIRALDTFGNLHITFDSTGKIISSKKTGISFGKKIADPTETFYVYSNGLLMYEVNKSKDKLVDSTAYDYGRFDRINSYTVYNNRKRVLYRYTFTYNSSRQMSTIRRRNEENYPVEMIKLKYDNDGILTEQQFYDDNMKHVSTAAFNTNLDENGRSNGTLLWTDGEGNLLSGTMTVADSSGLLLEKNTIDKDRKVTNYNTYRYNEQGDLASAKLFANMENIEIEITYKYDANGNWTEKQFSLNGKIIQVTTRNIQYSIEG